MPAIAKPNPPESIIVGPYSRAAAARNDEIALISHLLGAVRDGTMIDVGAHHGASLLRFAKRGWHVHAFEPDPANRKRLAARVRDLPNVRIDSRAVGERHQSGVPFYASPESAGISSLAPFRSTHRQVCTLEVTTLAEYCREAGVSRVDFLKIDTEGTDLRVLEGFPWEVVHPDVVLCEFEDAKTVSLGYDYRMLGDFLVGKGYEVYTSEWHPIIRYGKAHDWRRLVRYPCSLQDPGAWGNFIAFRSGVELARMRTAAASAVGFASRSRPSSAGRAAKIASPVGAPERAAEGPSLTAGVRRFVTIARRAAATVATLLRRRAPWIGLLFTLAAGAIVAIPGADVEWLAPWVLLPLLIGLYLRHKSALRFAGRDRELLREQLTMQRRESLALASEVDRLREEVASAARIEPRQSSFERRMEERSAELARSITDLDGDLARLAEVTGQLEEKVKLLGEAVSSEQPLRQQAHEDLLVRFAALGEQVDQRLDIERSERIVGLARRELTLRPPGRLLLLVTIPRSGSTWFLDSLRCHPWIAIEPSAIWFELLGLKGGRYPRGLADRADAELDFEIEAGKGARIPTFRPNRRLDDLEAPEREAKPFSVEKVHPEFFSFDSQRLLDRIARLRAAGVEVEILYQVRDPFAVAASLRAYKRREPSWYAHVSEAQLPGYLENSYGTMAQLIEKLHGPAVDYEDLERDHAALMRHVFRRLWRAESAERLGKIADFAAESSALHRRQRGGATAFFGAGRSQTCSADTEEWLMNCRALYGTVLQRRLKLE